MIPDDHCTLCESDLDRKGKDKILEIKMLGPERRVHESCWRGLTDYKPMGNGREEEILRTILEHEDEIGMGQWNLWRPDMDDPLSRYTILICSPVDPKRSPRGTYVGDPNQRWKDLTNKSTEGLWQEAIVELLFDGKPRTFNAICVEIADITADIGFEGAPFNALWTLVDWGMLQWSSRTPVRFRLNPTMPKLQVGETYWMGKKSVEILKVGGKLGDYWYTVKEVTGNAYDQYEHALVPKLKLEG